MRSDLVGVSANELANMHIDLETLWGLSTIELRERLCAAQKPSDRFFLLQKALGAHLFRTMEHHYAVGFALSVFGRMDSSLTLLEVVQKTGLSQRRFIEVFAREVGMSPKLFLPGETLSAGPRVGRLGRIGWAALTDTLLGDLLVKKSVLQIVLRRDCTLFRLSVKWKNRVRP